ncbi:MAG TPA: electron transfer flavoprotein subunit alpha/FixB family protein [Dehalococcoidia bacterium]|jgi:electron transfer flavoprotein alpha subunit|nr:electron transfer flavoprotein subunit alpha/FixB family protein [Dehalococcoidia bacterium]
MSDYKGVLVLAEVAQGKLAPIALELLGAGHGLAQQLGEQCSAALLGNGVTALAQEAIAYGADRVYVVDDPLLQDYQSDLYLAAMDKIITEASPQIVLLGQTSIGRDLAPRLAFRRQTGLSMDCVELSIDPETRLLLQTRPVYGGNARATFVSESRPQMATVRAKAMTPLERDASRQGEVVAVAAGLSPSMIRAKVVHRVKEEVEGIKLEDAQVIVGGGRGVGGPEAFKQLEELARILGGAVGASRPPCDSNWVPASLQIGLTGKVVTPELYIAIGISGASQHMAGCSGARNIVAINKNPEANIFNEASYGVVGDFRQVLPAFIAKVRELVGK